MNTMTTTPTATPRTDAAWSFAFTASEFSAASAARQMRDKCAELETELAAERERVRVLRSHGVEVVMVARSWQMVWGDKLSPESVAIFTKHEQAFLAALAATKEGA